MPRSDVVSATVAPVHEDNTTAGLPARLQRVTSPAERRVAEYLIEAGSKAAPMSAQEIATVVGTSDATVVRAAKSLGYASLRELRGALAGDGDEADLSARLQATIGGTASAHDLLATSADRQLKALHSNLQEVKGRVKAEVRRQAALRGINLEPGERVTKGGLILPK